MAEFEAYMERNTARRFDNLDSNITSIKGEVAAVRAAVGDNAAKIEEHNAIITRNQTSIADLKTEVMRLRSAPVPAIPELTAAEPRAEALPLPPIPDLNPEYDRARRSLRSGRLLE